MSLRRSPFTEAAPHFVYLIRHNPLNRKNSFLLSVFLPRTKPPPAQNAAANAAQSRNGVTFDVQSGADDTGLPMLVVRAPFNQTWQRLPATLEKVGMKVTDSTRSTGSMTATYKPLSDSAWLELGAKDPQLASGDYKIQVGDLDNRSSLQFIDPKGHTLTQSQNDAIIH